MSSDCNYFSTIFPLVIFQLIFDYAIEYKIEFARDHKDGCFLTQFNSIYPLKHSEAWMSKVWMDPVIYAECFIPKCRCAHCLGRCHDLNIIHDYSEHTSGLWILNALTGDSIYVEDFSREANKELADAKVYESNSDDNNLMEIDQKETFSAPKLKRCKYEQSLYDNSTGIAYLVSMNVGCRKRNNKTIEFDQVEQVPVFTWSQFCDAIK